MLFNVTAMAVNPNTGAVIGQRTEEIDTATNELFEDCMSPWEVEDRYEQYWNRLNSSWEHNFPAGKEKVVVLKVEAA